MFDSHCDEMTYQGLSLVRSHEVEQERSLAGYALFVDPETFETLCSDPRAQSLEALLFNESEGILTKLHRVAEKFDSLRIISGLSADEEDYSFDLSQLLAVFPKLEELWINRALRLEPCSHSHLQRLRIGSPEHFDLPEIDWDEADPDNTKDLSFAKMVVSQPKLHLEFLIQRAKAQRREFLPWLEQMKNEGHHRARTLVENITKCDFPDLRLFDLNVDGLELEHCMEVINAFGSVPHFSKLEHFGITTTYLLGAPTYRNLRNWRSM